MDIVLRESDRLNDTIRNFLAYARPQRAAVVDMDVRRVITDTARLLENSAEVHETHRIEVDVPAEPVVYRADEAQIETDRLEPRDQRAARDDGRRPVASCPFDAPSPPIPPARRAEKS